MWLGLRLAELPVPECPSAAPHWLLLLARGCPDPGRSQHLHQLLTPGICGDSPPVRRAACPGRSYQLRLVAGPGRGLLRLGGAQWCPLAHSCPVPQPAPTPRNAPICGHLSPSMAGWWGEERLRYPWHLLESWPGRCPGDGMLGKCPPSLQLDRGGQTESQCLKS
ncbi:hypothetical protein LEMLEM_LOCUS27817 [Lemmus lemmus]